MPEDREHAVQDAEIRVELLVEVADPEDPLLRVR
jgi:hypothetical protein